MKSYKKIATLFGLSLFYVSIINAQNNNDPILLKIGNEQITRSEFEKVYHKNNVKSESYDNKSLEEYLNLFINFKLKVKDAEENKRDTALSFKKELEGYRRQLSQPYLIDRDVNDKLLQETYDRMMYDIHASHILIKLSPTASPKDTLAAYNKIMDIRNKILKGEKFDKMAREFSDDPSAKDQAGTKDKPDYKGNGGDLGYFTVLQMLYPFETGAYNTKVGQISMPVRTKFGYHIIYVIDKRKAQGQIQTAHIMVKTSTNQSAEDSIKAKNKITEIYQKLKEGEKFEDLAKKYSDDYGSAQKGGVLPWFGTARMVPEYEKAAFALEKNGDYSEPFMTSYGWHIVKRLDKKDIPTFEEAKADLKSKISKDIRAQKPKEAFVEKLKKEYKFKETPKSKAEFIKIIDDSIFAGKWDIKSAKNLNKTLFTLGNNSYSQQDFAKFIYNHQGMPNQDKGVLINNLYNQFVSETCINYEDSRLEEKYPEFKALMKEYRDGMLLFDVTDQKVWSKAVKDTIGLQAFYDKNKSNYMWGERLDASIFTCANEKIASETHKLLEKSNLTHKEIQDSINKTSELNLQILDGKFSRKENEIIDKIEWKEGITDNINQDKSVVFVIVNKKLDPESKTLNEAKGIITSDYQSYLEKEWLISLKQKYPVEVNQQILSTVK